MTQGAMLPTRERLYRNISLLESVADYARRQAGEGSAPEDFSELSPQARAFLGNWQGHAATRLWLRLAQPTLDALDQYVDLDLTPAHGVPEATEDDRELRDALEASTIALSTLVERLEFQAARWTPRAEAS